MVLFIALPLFLYSLYADEIAWKQKFNIFDLQDKNIGWVNILVTKTTEVLTSASYKVEIETQSKLPFWFFTAESTTSEVEYLDKNFTPLEFKFNIISKNDTVNITGKTIDKGIDILWEGNKKKKNILLPLTNNICTAGNLRFLILSRGLSDKKAYQLNLLDKYKLKYQKVKVSIVEESEKKNYIVKLNLGAIGKFSFVSTPDGNVLEGKGMGIKLVALP